MNFMRHEEFFFSVTRDTFFPHGFQDARTHTGFKLTRQINNVYSTINSTEARLTTLVQGLVGGEQTRAEGIENALTISIAQEASRAISNERQISSAVAGAATATQLLSQSVATLLATDQSRLNTTLATLAAAFTGQLQTWQALINPQLSGIASTLSTVNVCVCVSVSVWMSEWV